MQLIRRLRGVVGTMGVWAIVFASAGAAGLIPLLLLDRLPPFELGRFLQLLGIVLVRWGLFGAAMGGAFAAAVLLAERKRTLAALSHRRFAAWGFAAGAIVPMTIGIAYELTGHSSIAINLRTGFVFAGICGAIGAALAATTLRAARASLAPVGDPLRSLDEHLPIDDADDRAAQRARTMQVSI